MRSCRRRRAGADLAFDLVGNPLVAQLLGAVRTRGSVVCIGFAGGTAADFDVADVVVHEKRVLGYDAWLEADADVATAFEALGRFIAAGQIRPAIDSIFAIEEYAAANRRLASRQATGAILLRL